MTYGELIEQMQQAAQLLAGINSAYEGGTLRWSPEELIKEALYLIRHTTPEEEV